MWLSSSASDLHWSSAGPASSDLLLIFGGIEDQLTKLWNRASVQLGEQDGLSLELGAGAFSVICFGFSLAFGALLWGLSLKSDSWYFWIGDFYTELCSEMYLRPFKAVVGAMSQVLETPAAGGVAGEWPHLPSAFKVVPGREADVMSSCLASTTEQLESFRKKTACCYWSSKLFSDTLWIA